MLIINTYLSREICKFFCLLLTVVLGVYLIVDFFQKLDDFFEAGLPISRALVYFALKIPFIVAQVLPVCLLLAVTIVFGLMNKNNELTVLRSSGVSVYLLLRPVLALGVLGSAALFFFTDVAVPVSTQLANKIWLEDVQKKEAAAGRQKDIWVKGKREIIHVRYFDRVKKIAYGLTVHRMDADFRLVRRLDANQAVFRDGLWHLTQVLEQRLDAASGAFLSEFAPEKSVRIDLVPADLGMVAKRTEEMSFAELLTRIREIRADGHDPSDYRVDLHAKLAFPFTCLILLIAGTGMALRSQRREALAAGVAYGIGMAFLYWLVYSLFIALGYAEVMAPLIAAWAANVVFLCFGVITLLNAQ
jgi:lipopolysaccharide export system permease protein